MMHQSGLLNNHVKWLLLSGAAGAFAGSGAAELLGDETQGLALDFTDDHFYTASSQFYGSARILDTSTPANDYNTSPVTEASSLLTYTSPSSKMTLGPSGTHRYGAHNLCLQSENVQTTWTANATTVATTSDEVRETTASGVHEISQTITTVPSATYALEAEIKIGLTRTRVILNFGGASNGAYTVFDIDGAQIGVTTTGYGSGYSSGGTPTITSVGDGWYRCAAYVTVGATSSILYIRADQGSGTAALNQTYAGSTSAGFYVRKVRVSRYPADTTYLRTSTAARYDLPYEWDASGVLRGICMEPEATNAFSNNTTPSTYVTAEGSSITNNAVESTTGLTTAHTFTTTTVGSGHRIYRTSVLMGATSYTLSVYVKTEDTSGYYLGIRESSATGSGAVFDPSDWSVVGTYATGSVSAVTATSVDVGNGWTRLIATFASTSMAVGFGLLFVNPAWTSGNFYSSWAPADTYSVSLWGIQAESGTVATSPILTYGPTATRLADEASRAVTGYPHSATVNSGLVQFIPLNAATATAVIQLDDGTSDEVVSIGYDASANIGLTVTDGGAAQTAPLADGTVTATAIETIGFSWKANDFLLSDNGATAVADTSGTLPTVTTLKIRASGGPILLRKLLLVPVEKTAAEVEAYGATS